MKYEDDIHNCTNKRLAEILEYKAAGYRKRLEMTINPDELFVELTLEWATLLEEAAARLRARHKCTFNSEAFE